MKPLRKMRLFKANLHIHTVLSPCGDLEMSPHNIVRQAAARGLDIIAITDHNTARQCRVVKQIAGRYGIHVLCGVEINTREEVHCLALFDQPEQIGLFDQELYQRLADIPNDPDRFGYQVVVDENDQILEQPAKLLISSVDMGIGEVEQRVHELGGLFVPAHIDRLNNGIIAQLGFIPPDLNCDALEISRHTTREKLITQYPYLEHYSFIQSSDAHFPQDIGAVYTLFQMEQPGIKEISLSMRGVNQRKILKP